MGLINSPNTFDGFYIHFIVKCNSHGQFVYFCMTPQLNMKPILIPNWFVLQRKCADPCIHRLAITAREGSVIFIII